MKDNETLIKDLAAEMYKLRFKYNKLYNFIYNLDSISEISLEQRVLMEIQLKIMASYIEVLTSRIMYAKMEKK